MYVAVKGGETAIANAHRLLADRRRGDRSLPSLTIEQILSQLALAVAGNGLHLPGGLAHLVGDADQLAGGILDEDGAVANLGGTDFDERLGLRALFGWTSCFLLRCTALLHQLLGVAHQGLEVSHQYLLCILCRFAGHGSLPVDECW